MGRIWPKRPMIMIVDLEGRGGGGGSGGEEGQGGEGGRGWGRGGRAAGRRGGTGCRRLRSRGAGRRSRRPGCRVGCSTGRAGRLCRRKTVAGGGHRRTCVCSGL